MPPEPIDVAEPPAELPRSASVERDGVRVTIELDRNPMPAGAWTGVRTTVTNTGSDDLTWFHDGCAISVGVVGWLPGRQWRPGFATFDGAAAGFQQRALDHAIDDAGIWLRFVPERWAGRGSFGCADIGMSDVVAPGASIDGSLVWDGLAGVMLAPPPGGPVTLTATFQYFWRGEAGGIEDMGELPVQLDAWIEPLDGALVQPTEAIDLALLDPRFVAFLESQPAAGTETVVRFDASRLAWEVGLLEHHDDGTASFRGVLVDAREGALIAAVERAWDYDTEGFP